MKILYGYGEGSCAGGGSSLGYYGSIQGHSFGDGTGECSGHGNGGAVGYGDGHGEGDGHGRMKG